MSFDVIIVNYRCHGALATCLSALEKESAELGRVFVVDNSEVPPLHDLIEIRTELGTGQLCS